MENTSDKVYLGLGSNLGDRLGHLRCAVELIGQIESTRVIATSSVYETQPRFYSAQPDFLNACVRVETRLGPRELLGALQDIEAKLGRKRLIENGPRTVDLDVLLYDAQIIEEPALSLPHPGLHERAFVLVPLIEVMGEAASSAHPVLNRAISELLADCPDAGWVRVFSPPLEPSLKGA